MDGIPKRIGCHEPVTQYAISPADQLEFQETLRGFTEESVLAINGLTQWINHKGRFAFLDTDQKTGLYVNEQFIEQLPRNRGISFDFRPQPGNRLGREDSHNNVFFGKALVIDNQRPALEVPIAVKPQAPQGRPTNLAEYAMHNYLEELSIPTLRPLGLAVAENRDFLITYFSDGVVTLDSLDWCSFSTGQKWDQVVPVVDTLALLHEHALFHSDLEFRNVAIDQGGDVVIVDPELMVSARDLFDQAAKELAAGHTNGPGMEAVIRLMSAEFTLATKSIDELVIGSVPKRERARTPEAKFKLHKQHLYEPYKAQIAKSDSPYKEVLLTCFDYVLLDRKNKLAK